LVVKNPRHLPATAKNRQTKKTTNAKDVKADAMHVVAAEVAAAVVETALSEQNGVKEASVETVRNAANVPIATNAPIARTTPTRPKMDAHPVKNADAADATTPTLALAKRPTSPICPTATRLSTQLAAQKTTNRLKPRHAPKHAMNAHRVAKTVATSARAQRTLPKPKHLPRCLLPKHLKPTMKLHPITTVIAVNAVHATAMDEIVASAVESAAIA
jgi:hypothetical protein